MSYDEITPDMLNDVRWQIPCVMEELGALASFIREAISDCNGGNIRGAAMVAGDAIEAFATLESRLSEMAADVAKWIDYVERRTA